MPRDGLPGSAWPPSRNGYPTCPVCGELIEHDPGPRGVVVLPEDPLAGRYAHRLCAVPAAEQGGEG